MDNQQQWYNNLITFSLLRRCSFSKVFYGHCKYLLQIEKNLKYAFNEPTLSHSKVGSLHSFSFPAPHYSFATLLWLGGFYPVTKLTVPNLYKNVRVIPGRWFL